VYGEIMKSVLSAFHQRKTTISKTSATCN